MKILFVGNGLLYSDNYPHPFVGGSVQTWGLSKELAKRGHEVYIVRRSAIKEEIVENVNLVGVDFKGVDIWAPHYSYIFYAGALTSRLYFSKKSLREISRIKPDIICLIDRLSGIFPAGLSTSKLYIMHVPEALDFFKPYSIHANKLNCIVFYIKKLIESVILQRVNKIVVLNSYIEKYLKKKGFSNVIKIPNAIDPKHFTNRGDKNYILYGGRFDWNKNVCSLIEVFAELQASHNDYRLYLVGAGTEEGKVRSLVKKKNLQSNVTIIPWLPRQKFIDIMSKCSFFVLPSFFEVAPVVILEAMASGKPVIARANMGSAEVIIHGYNGFLFENNHELEKYLKLLLSNGELRKKMAKNARKTVEEKYAFKKIADLYEKYCFN